MTTSDNQWVAKAFHYQSPSCRMVLQTHGCHGDQSYHAASAVGPVHLVSANASISNTQKPVPNRKGHLGKTYSIDLNCQ